MQGHIIACFCAFVSLLDRLGDPALLPLVGWCPVLLSVASVLQLCSDLLCVSLQAKSSSLPWLSSTVLFSKRTSLAACLSHLRPRHVLGLYPPFIIFPQHRAWCFCLEPGSLVTQDGFRTIAKYDLECFRSSWLFTNSLCRPRLALNSEICWPLPCNCSEERHSHHHLLKFAF